MSLQLSVDIIRYVLLLSSSPFNMPNVLHVGVISILRYEPTLIKNV